MNKKGMIPIQINMLTKDHEALTKKANELGLTLTAFCRMQILKSLK